MVSKKLHRNLGVIKQTNKQISVSMLFPVHLSFWIVPHIQPQSFSFFFSPSLTLTKPSSITWSPDCTKTLFLKGISIIFPSSMSSIIWLWDCTCVTAIDPDLPSTPILKLLLSSLVGTFPQNLRWSHHNNQQLFYFSKGTKLNHQFVPSLS